MHCFKKKGFPYLGLTIRMCLMQGQRGEARHTEVKGQKSQIMMLRLILCPLSPVKLFQGKQSNFILRALQQSLKEFSVKLWTLPQVRRLQTDVDGYFSKTLQVLCGSRNREFYDFGLLMGNEFGGYKDMQSFLAKFLQLRL